MNSQDKAQEALPPMPNWLGLQEQYAEAAALFQSPSTLTFRTEPWLVLMVDLATGMQEGLRDALRTLRRATEEEVLERLSPQGRLWFEQLDERTQRQSLCFIRGTCAGNF